MTRPAEPSRPDIYARITQQIITQLEAGVRPWIQPWVSTGSVTVVHTGNLSKFSLEMPGDGGEVSSGAGGQFTWYRLPIESLEIGGRSLEVDEIRTLDLTPVVSRLQEAAGVEVDGVVGQDILTRFKGVLDVGTQTLFLQPVASNP